MSVARVYTVQKSRARRKGGGKLPICEKCRTVINIGDPYRYFYVGFRSNWERVRCMKAECTPRTSELESSKLSAAYEAQETAEDALDQTALDPGETTDLEEVIQTFAESLRDLGQEYRDADEQFGGGGMTDNSQRADDLEQAADELDGFGISETEPDYDGCENEAHDLEPTDEKYLERGSEDCEDCMDIKATWWSDAVDEARDAISNVSYGG